MSGLESEHIRLRALEPADVELLFNWENDPDLWLISNTLVPFSKYILRQYIKNSHLDIYQTKQLRMMIDLKQGDEVDTIGTIDLFDFDPYHFRAGIGILIKEEKDRRKGYASEALKLFVDYCFRTLQLHQVYCNVSEDNDSSLKLFQKQGFVVIGVKKEWLRDGKSWRSEYLLQLINEE
jgi:diamine N-acetyltransferase